MKLTLMEWADRIDDNNLHHIGEYYTYLTGKPFARRSHKCTAGCKKWISKIPDSELNWIAKHFDMFRDWEPGAFIIRRRG